MDEKKEIKSICEEELLGLLCEVAGLQTRIYSYQWLDGRVTADCLVKINGLYYEIDDYSDVDGSPSVELYDFESDDIPKSVKDRLKKELKGKLAKTLHSGIKSKMEKAKELDSAIYEECKIELVEKKFIDQII